MPAWIKNSLFGIMLLCCMVIGVRVYVEISSAPPAQDDSLAAGAVSSDSIPDQLPQFTLNDMWGEPRSIDEWAGQPLLLNFWATWCAPCRREMPLLQALHSSQQELQVLGIAIDRPDDVQRWMTESGFTYPTLVGEIEAMKVSDQFGLDGLGLPFTVLVGAGGEILTVFIGEIHAEELEAMADISRSLNAGQIDVPTARKQLAAL